MRGFPCDDNFSLKIFGIRHRDVGLEVCAPDRMQAMNKEYRGLDRVTDVLTFPFYEVRPPASLRVPGFGIDSRTLPVGWAGGIPCRH